MKPPVLLVEWDNQIAYRPARSPRHIENFFLVAHAPNRRSALWLEFMVVARQAELTGRTTAILFGEHLQAPLAFQDQVPSHRILLDAERAGIGLGECSLEENRSRGECKGSGKILSWELNMTDFAPPYRPLPAAWMYRSRQVPAKMCTPHPYTELNGSLELWDGVSRHAHCEILSLDGWTGMQAHHWGSSLAPKFAWAQCNQFDEAPADTLFEVMAGDAKIGPFSAGNVALGRLNIGDEVYRFDTLRSALRGASKHSGLSWEFSMRGPNGTLKGNISAQGADCMGLQQPDPALGQSFPVALCPWAKVELEVHGKNGAKHHLRSSRGLLRMGDSSIASQVSAWL